MKCCCLSALLQHSTSCAVVLYGGLCVVRGQQLHPFTQMYNQRKALVSNINGKDNEAGAETSAGIPADAAQANPHTIQHERINTEDGQLTGIHMYEDTDSCSAACPSHHSAREAGAKQHADYYSSQSTPCCPW